jgi:Sulfotransferase family
MTADGSEPAPAAGAGHPPDADALRRELDAVNRERLRLRHELESVEASLTWRATFPLRALGAALGRVLRPVRRLLPAPFRPPRRRPAELGTAEWLARRRPRLRPPTGEPPRPAAGAAEHWLTPVLVDYSTRDGSTLMMRLLASSPQIAVELSYPFERKYFAYLWRWARLLDRTDWPAYLWGKADLASLDQEAVAALLGPPPWLPRELIGSGAGEPPLSATIFELAWREFSDRATGVVRERSGDPALAVRYYAEKHLNTWRLDLAELPPVRVLVLLRDPRDTFVSERAAGMLGSSAGGGPEEHLEAFVRRQRRRLAWIAGHLETGEHPVVRYEDLVGDLAGVASRLGSWLGVELDAAAVEGDRRLRRRHVTAASPAASLGRWREELDPEIAERFGRELGAELRAVGYEVL